jgi:hypothetical protein
MQRLLGNVSALQFVTVYSELGGDATLLPPSPSLVRNQVPRSGETISIQTSIQVESSQSRKRARAGFDPYLMRIARKQ